jgi:long-chain fatty acid transport protein
MRTPGIYILFFLGAAVPAAAQRSAAPEVGFSSVPFRFFPPGARSLGMGSTFVAVADDATAVTSNPAGLVILPQPEFSFHGRLTSLSSAEEEAAGSTSTSSSNRAGVSFLSGVYPHGRLRVSAYYQQVSDFEVGHGTSGDFVFTTDTGPQTVNVRSVTSVDLQLAEIGVGAAARVGSHLSVGGSLARRRLQLGYANRNTFATRPVFHDVAEADDADAGLAFNLGVLVNPSGTWSAGAVWKRGGRFHLPYTVDFEGAPGGPVRCADGGECAAAEVPIPDVWGAGGAFRPSGKWLVSVDLSLLRYSQLSATPLRRIPFELYPPVTNELLPPDDFDDVVQVNVGGERIFVGEPIVAVRAGFSHRPEFNPGGSVPTAATFFTAGAGAVFHDRLQIDVAGSTSKELHELLVSLVFRL